MQYIGFAPEEGALKGSRLQVKAIISHISRVQITPDTPNLTVVQYARAVALLLLGGMMCPDSSGNLVSLLYLAKLEDIVAARNYSWGSAVLVFLYRELCNASIKGKAAIGGALQLVQIWAWSRIIPLCPGLGAPRVHMGQHSIDNNCVLPAAPYDAMWNYLDFLINKCTDITSFPIISDILKPPKGNASNFFGTTLSRIHSHQNSIPTLSRRLFLPSVSGLWDALTGGNSAREAVIAVRRGMLLFRQGDVLGSLVEFDKAIELDPRQKACVGLDLFSIRFEEGAEQFRLDVAQNPNDTEESIWCFLCEAQLYGVDEARRRFLEVGTDPRPVMREAYNMFKDGGDPEKIKPNSHLHFEEWGIALLLLLQTAHLIRPHLLLLFATKSHTKPHYR
ncbi:hypothetical protein Sango_0677200 [Sesamum angolense]|uniref:Aminotransferase-like plant mobile domain-containing protein n=1 Tax=Sesamum angolense TaxID=2727404 RepID=A0AAE1X8A8_9LAMI|nr:hypothetical protein Sango_0677200 [Sesamum angolense]